MKILFKKLLLICGIITAVSATANFLVPQSVFADDNTIFQSTECKEYLGLKAWYCDVVITDSENGSSFQKIWMIAVNVLHDITVVAAYLIIGYVIYGGYLYIFSGGDTSKVANGKKTLYQAFIGLAIVMSANIIMAGIRIALIGNNGTLAPVACDADNPCDATLPGLMFTNALQWAVAMVGVVSVVFIIYGGISYITSAGDAGKLQKAKNTITYALIGLAIVALAEAITAFVSSMIREANQDAYINKTTISKEVHEIKKIN